ncbi:VWA domain-containing protein [Isosphaeraceae bacterium EP7]
MMGPRARFVSRWPASLGLVAMLLAATQAPGQLIVPKTKEAGVASKPAETVARPVSAGKSKAADGPILVRPRTAEGVADSLRGTDERYGPGVIDWSKVEPWDQASFFGVKAKGKVFVFVVDCSGSMDDNSRMVRARSELRRSIMRLQYPQRFKVLLYNDDLVNTAGPSPVSADLNHKLNALRWLDAIEPSGGTEPLPALSLAVALRPDAIFLLSDGEYPEGTANEVAGRNRAKIPIHCIDLSGGTAGDQLRQIAKDSGGKFVAK